MIVNVYGSLIEFYIVFTTINLSTDVNKINMNDRHDCRSSGSSRSSVHILESFKQMQHLALVVLKDYWLPRFLLHAVRLQKYRPKPDPGAYTIQNIADLTVLEDLKGIDATLRLVQGRLSVNERTRRAGAEVC